MSSQKRENWPGWNQLPGAFSQIEGNTGKYPNYQNIIHEVVEDLKPSVIVEIGFNAGHGACCMLDAAPDDTQMYTFDIVRRDYEQPAFDSLKSIYGDRLTLTAGQSKETLEPFLEENNIKIDFAFVDGCHGGGRNECCKDFESHKTCPFIDIEICKKFMNVGGIIFVDDMGVADVTGCFNAVNWEDYEDLESVIKGRPSEKWFKMMRRVK